jgi:hypothetical protein
MWFSTAESRMKKHRILLLLSFSLLLIWREIRLYYAQVVSVVVVSEAVVVVVIEPTH